MSRRTMQDLIAEADAIVRRTGRAVQSELQRTLRLTIPHAAALIAELERRGIITPYCPGDPDASHRLIERGGG